MTGRAAAPVEVVRARYRDRRSTQRECDVRKDIRQSPETLPPRIQARLEEPPAYGGRTLHDSWQPEERFYAALRETEAAAGHIYWGKVNAWKTAQENARRLKISFDRPFPDPPSGRKPRAERRFGDGSLMFPETGPETGPGPAKPDDGLVKDAKADRDAAIFAAWKGGQSQRALASTFGLSQSRIHQILRELE